MAVYRLWPSTNGPAVGTSDSADYTLGCEFESDVDATLTAIYFWVASSVQNTSSKEFTLFQVNSSSSGTNLGTENSGTLSAGQWNRVAFSPSISLTANQRYRACVSFEDGNGYSSTANYWVSGGGGASGISNGPLNAPNAAGATGNDQCQFSVTANIAYPTSSFENTNYWIDPEITTVDVDTDANAGSVAITVDATDSTTRVAPTPVQPLATTTAHTPTKLIAVIQNSLVGVSALQPQISTSESGNPTSGLIGVVGNNSPVRLGPNVENNPVGVTTNNPSIDSKFSPQFSQTSVASLDTSSTVSTSIGLGLVGVSALDASVSTSGNTNVSAGLASIGVASQQPTTDSQSFATPQVALLGITGHIPSFLTSTTPEVSDVSVQGLNPAVNSGSSLVAQAQTASVGVVAHGLTTSLSSNIQVALVGTVSQPVNGSVSALPGVGNIGTQSEDPIVLTGQFVLAGVAHVGVQPLSTQHLLSLVSNSSSVAIVAITPTDQSQIPPADVVVTKKNNNVDVLHSPNVVTIIKGINSPGG